MEKFTTLTGVAAPLRIINVDTDMIIPKQYLKTIQRTGLGKGLFSGKGTLTYADGKEYTGSFANDLPDGEGRLTSPDGSVYVGAFKHGRRNGHGRITYPDGRVAEGTFKDDLLRQ